MGRPKLPDGEKRFHRSVRLTQAEIDFLESGGGLSETIRVLIAEAMGRPAELGPPVDVEVSSPVTGVPSPKDVRRVVKAVREQIRPAKPDEFKIPPQTAAIEGDSRCERCRRMYAYPARNEKCRDCERGKR